MTIKNEKFEILANYLAEDQARAKALSTVSAEEACARINADGYDFVADDLIAFAEIMQAAPGMKQGELTEDDLDNVTGGLILTAAGITAAVWCCAGISVACAYAQAWLASHR